MIRIVATVILSVALFAPNCVKAQNPEWHRPFPGFKIAGNLYYVGTADLAVYLVRTSKGNILINSDFAEDVPLIKTNIQQLGFDYRDTKILLISHAHDDHDGGMGLIRARQGLVSWLWNRMLPPSKARHRDIQVQKSIVCCTTVT